MSVSTESPLLNQPSSQQGRNWILLAPVEADQARRLPQSRIHLHQTKLKGIRQHRFSKQNNEARRNFPRHWSRLQFHTIVLITAPGAGEDLTTFRRHKSTKFQWETGSYDRKHCPHGQYKKTYRTVSFNAVENLATSVILGCDYCDLHVDAIRPRLKIVKIDNGSTVPIVLQTSKANTELPFSEQQQFSKQKVRESPKIKVTRRTRLQPGTQT